MNEFLTLMKSELVITVLLFLLLIIKLGRGLRNETLLPLVQVLLLLNVIAGFFYNGTGHLFGDMFFTNPAIAFEKNLVNLAAYLITMLCSGWLKQSKHMTEYLMLMLSAMLGMFLMISAGNLLIFYLSLELATIPVAAMSNFDLDRKNSSEAAMKMILSSAFSSGILLFGISLIYGATGSISFVQLNGFSDHAPLLILGFVFLFTAFAFKLSVVPFHFWTADVYEGSPIPTTAFLSVASKGAVAFIFISTLYRVFGGLHDVWYTMLLILSVLTMVIGNLFALRQNNIKRFLAFSSIAQVGFILVGISNGGKAGMVSVIYFILIYIFSNLAAFGVASAIQTASDKETIDDYKGLYKTNPFLSWILALALFSLAGIPPTAGFFGKFFLITAGAQTGDYWFITVAALNMIISLFYYLRVVRAVFMDKNENPIAPIVLNRTLKLAFILCGAAIVLIGLAGRLFDYIDSLI